MKAAGKISTLIMVLLMFGGIAFAQDSDSNMAEKQKAPTVLGGTGLFNTFSTRTLCKGEFNFAVFWNNFSRDPGDLSINQIPFNITVGLTNKWELWADWITWQQTTSRSPFLLSGYQLSAARVFGDPTVTLGPAKGGFGSAAAFYPGTGAGVGGLLPTPGRFGQPIGFPTSVFSPGGPSGPPAIGLGPPIVTQSPNYYPEAPFFGEVDFLGFNSLGQAVFGPRESSNGTGDIYVGSKYRLVNPDTHWFSLALGGYLKIPVSETDEARATGRTNGVFEGGPILMFGQEGYNHRLRLYENVGYIRVGDIHEHGLTALDLPDKLLLAGGLSYGVNKHLELVTEVSGNLYVGKHTPDLDLNNPFDWNIGARFYFLNGALSFGGAYRRFITNEGAHTYNVANFAGVRPPFFFVPFFNTVPETFADNGSPNGFVAYLSMGRRKSCPPPPAPTCVVEAAPASVNRGEALKLTAKPSTPGYPDNKVSYDYKWDVKDAQGRPVGLSGSGASVDVATGQLACGAYTVTSTITATVPMVNCPTDCVTTGQTTCTTTFTITEPPCPTVSCDISASPTSVNAGEKITLTANGHGEGNLSYTWSTTAGTLSSTTGTEVTLDTTGTSGSITVTVNVATDKTHCGEACPGSSCTTSVTVNMPPQVIVNPLSPCGPIFFPLNSARINNEHKACLDDIALKLQQDPRASVVIDGHRDSKERVGISLTRANNARDYLVNEKGVDAARITVRNFGDTCPHESGDAALNRRVEFWILPEGATVQAVDSMKKCAAGSSPQVLTNEEPAQGIEKKPARHRRKRYGKGKGKGKKPAPVVMMTDPQQ